MIKSILKWTALFLVGVLCILAMISGYSLLIGSQPGTTYNVTYKTVSGDPTLHDQVYEVMIIDGINETYVENALLMVPNEFGFIIVPPDTSRYGPAGWKDYPDTPFPVGGETYLIIVCDITRYQNTEWDKLIARGWTTPPDGRVVILVNASTCPEMRLTEIIEHECGHNVELTPKLDNFTWNIPGFNSWLGSVGYGYYPGDMAAWSLLYNRYVIFEYLDEGRRVEA